ncbi:MAG: HEAT repeat domain-containing protein [Planctomycetes bacterium]|nr:HEAT repeat domain-containing protein [Planctomycetota bacterium]
MKRTPAVVLSILAAALPFRGAAAQGTEERLSRIADLEDRRTLGEDGGLIALSRDAEPAVRERAVVALGRIQDAAAADALVLLLADEVVEVRRAAAFALGQTLAPQAVEPLQAALADPDPELRALATEALGKMKSKESRAAVERLLGDPEPAVRELAALALGKLGEADSIEALRRALDREPRPDPEFEWRILYAIGRIGGPAAVPLLSAATTRRTVLSRTFAALFLARIATPSCEAPLRELATDPEPMVAASAARGLASFPGEPAEQALARALAHPNFHVRGEAARALAAIRTRRRIPALERALEKDPSRTVRRAAFHALVRLAHPAAEARLRELIPVAGVDTESAWLLVAAAGAIGERVAAGGDPEATRLAGEIFRGESSLAGPRAPPGVDVARAAILEGAAAAPSENEEAFALLLSGLAIPDLAVRGTAADALRSRGDARAVGALAEAYKDSLTREGEYEVREYLVEALSAIDDPSVLPLLEKALADPAPSVREVAANSIEKRTGKRPEVAILPATYRAPPAGLEPRPGAASRVTFETEKGTIEIDLYPADAPAHVANFLSLIEKGFYDGKTIHRVVWPFVVQGGDPRGDGWGDAGYTIRDEVGRRRFVRGTLGMPKAGKDTGGCQFFVAHLPTPHLDGNYTVFGQVVVGLSVLDSLEVGDRILSARAVGR